MRRLFASSFFLLVAASTLAALTSASMQRVLRTEPAPTSPPLQNCTPMGGETFTCAPGLECCGDYDTYPQCINASVQECCTWYAASTACAPGLSCCGAGGPGASSSAFCCSASTTCCASTGQGESSCCASDSERCCAGDSSFCCGKNQECCGSQCCGEGQVCCGGTTCCAIGISICDSNGQCQYVTRHPGPYANWSTVWSEPITAPCIRTEPGLLCSNIPDWLSLVDPRTGNTLWNVTSITNISESQSFVPVQLYHDIFYVAGYGVNVTSGQVLWREDATASCTTGGDLAVFPDGPSNFVVTCTSAPLNFAVFSFAVSTGTVHFNSFTDLVNATSWGTFAVSKHVIVYSIDSTFYARNAFSGNALWNLTVPANNVSLSTPLTTPAADAFIFTLGRNVTALRYEDGRVLWSHARYVSENFTFQTTGRVPDLQSKGHTVEVVVWVGAQTELIFTESRTGVTRFHTPVPSETEIFAANQAYVWMGGPRKLTAIAFAVCEVEWVAQVPHGYLALTAGSPFSNSVYAQGWSGGLTRYVDGKPQHELSVTSTDPGLLTVSQYDRASVVVVGFRTGAVAFELPPQ